jgi:hypothetical protein
MVYGGGSFYQVDNLCCNVNGYTSTQNHTKIVRLSYPYFIRSVPLVKRIKKQPFANISKGYSAEKRFRKSLNSALHLQTAYLWYIASTRVFFWNPVN